ncbi:monoglyceride lipase-like [Clavelina lepadiformis]|uniref:monoglyceride lipase-like n=1 Tax=Clavelina lepadiformis TaxID=159417 RepID=UPI0040430542
MDSSIQTGIQNYGTSLFWKMFDYAWSLISVIFVWFTSQTENLSTSNSIKDKKQLKKTFSGKFFDDVKHFVNHDNQHIFCKHWEPKDSPRGLVLIIHGYAEHCGRYDSIVEMFNSLGLHVFSHDHVGHGESEGNRADVTDYRVYLRDILHHINLVKTKYPGLPLYIFGHSMGGSLAILLAHENPNLAKCVILSSPSIALPDQISPVKILALKCLFSILPNIGVETLDPKMLSKDKTQVEKYQNDLLVYHGKILLRMGYQIYRMTEHIKSILHEISYPFLIIHGSNDCCCKCSGSEDMYQKAKSSDKTFKIYQDGFHELMHEIGDVPDQFLADIKKWLQERV